VLYAVTRHTRAKEYFNEALMRDSCEPYSLFHLARIRWLEGRPDLSRNYLARLGQIDGQRIFTGDSTD
jgi:hypothetical protein